MKNIFKIIFLLLFFAFLFFSPLANVLAQNEMNLNQGLSDFGNTAGYGQADLPQVVGNIIKIVLGLLGLIGVIIIITGGVIWLTSAGDPEKIKKARRIMQEGIIGMIIILSSYAIVAFIMTRFAGITGEGWTGSGGDPGGSGSYGDVFKITKIETTHGGDEASYHQDVYLCSAVQPLFNSRVNSGKIDDLVLDESIKITNNVGEIFTGTWQTRNNAIIFKHVATLFDANTNYSAYLPKQILDSQGRTLQECIASGNCQETGSNFIWDFTTGETTDIINPEVTSTYPISDINDLDYPDTNVSMNPVIQVRFSEPIDVTTVMDENNNLIANNIWVDKLSEEGGAIEETFMADVWEVEMAGNGFNLELIDSNLLESFTWYRIHVEHIMDLCGNEMTEAKEWEFQTNDSSPGIKSWHPTGDNTCPDADIMAVFNTSMYNKRVEITLTGGGDNINISINPSQVGEPYSVQFAGGTFRVDDVQNMNKFKVFILELDNNLQNNTPYNVSIMTDLVMNQQGDLLTHSWDFTSATLETCVCSPFISRLTPDQGSEGECLTIHGSCLAGTTYQPAEPFDVNFVAGAATSTIITMPVQGYDGRYITTMVPSDNEGADYLEGDILDVKTSIVYEDSGQSLESNSSQFYVDSLFQAQGPCLFKITPAYGYPNINNVDLRGIRFDEESELSQVRFYSNKIASYDSWTDIKVSSALVPLGTVTGDVVLINNIGQSNPLPFTSLDHQLPVITEISPNRGTNDITIPTYITITGEHFSNNKGQKYIGFKDSQENIYTAEIGCNNWSDTKIVAVVPAELTMDESYQVAVIDPYWGESNKEDFFVTAEFHPAICKLNPNNGNVGDNIDINGISFGNDIGDSNVTFAGTTIDGIDENNWENISIGFNVPNNQEQEADVIVRVRSPIETGFPLKASNPVPFYKPPKIIKITPDNGPLTTWITIKGENFGSSFGNVYFKYNGINYLADSLPDFCPSNWTNEQIIVVVPNELPALSEESNNYDVDVFIETSAGINSNEKSWEVNKSPLGPALCSIDPYYGLVGYSPIEIKGVRFTLEPEITGRELIFKNNKLAGVLSWVSDTLIDDIAVPAQAVTGGVFVRKKIKTNFRLVCNGFQFGETCFGDWEEIWDEEWINSNSLHFMTEIPEGEELLMVAQRNDCSSSYRTPNPWPDSDYACKNAGILVEFNQIVTTGLNNNNIIIKKCNSANEDFDQEDCVVISGSIIEMQLSNYTGVKFEPDNLLDANYWYQAIIKSGPSGVVGETGNQLDGNENGFEDNTPNDDYVWKFKTNNQEELCPVEQVMLIENVPADELPGKIIHPNTRDYFSSAIGPNCQILTSGMTWAWASSDIGIATITPQTEPSQAQAESVSLGEIDIVSTTTLDGQDTEAQIHLEVATQINIESINPSNNESGVCRNIFPIIVFNQKANLATISSTTINFYGKYEASQTELNCYEEAQGVWWCELPIVISKFHNANNKTEVYINVGLLIANNDYKIEISGGENGIYSFYDIVMGNDYLFEFSTKEDICSANLIDIDVIPEIIENTQEISENDFIFFNAGDDIDFMATVKDDDNNQIIQVTNLYEWQWLWSSSDQEIININDSSTTDNETGVVQNNNGNSEIIGGIEIIIDALNQTVGDQYLKKIQTKVFLCENPWFYQDWTGGTNYGNAVGENEETNFELLYCRD
ncbi:Ig-like domain-containing protein [Patescibacteria group bacterium]|nr:Ig-like domain-containing protein [Patescibacteria group bacterium]